MTRLVLLLCLLLPARASAQRIHKQAFAQDTVRVLRPPVIRYGKWLTLGGAAGAAGWGISANREADRRYADLERLCRDTPARCTRQSPNGAFNDAGLEGEYQDIIQLDDRAKYALAAGQLAIAATVVLFILDLPRGSSTQDIPYEPKILVGPGTVRLRLTF